MTGPILQREQAESARCSRIYAVKPCDDQDSPMHAFTRSPTKDEQRDGDEDGGVEADPESLLGLEVGLEHLGVEDILIVEGVGDELRSESARKSVDWPLKRELQKNSQ